MTINDIITYPINDYMIEQARADANQLKEKWGRGTRAATEDRDITGSLAHQAVEHMLMYNDRDFRSSRTDRLEGGDKGDIFYEGDVIDVKGTHGALDEKYFYNKQFLVFDKELSGMERKGITHLMFVLVDLPGEKAHIYGAISLPEFMEKSVPVRIKWDNHAIKANQLKSFNNYINRV